MLVTGREVGEAGKKLYPRSWYADINLYVGISIRLSCEHCELRYEIAVTKKPEWGKCIKEGEKLKLLSMLHTVFCSFVFYLLNVILHIGIFPTTWPRGLIKLQKIIFYNHTQRGEWCIHQVVISLLWLRMCIDLCFPLFSRAMIIFEWKNLGWLWQQADTIAGLIIHENNPFPPFTGQ